MRRPLSDRVGNVATYVVIMALFAFVAPVKTAEELAAWYRRKTKERKIP